MNYRNILALIALVVVVGVFSLLSQQPWQALGSVDTDSGGYRSTTTPSAVLYTAGQAQLKTGTGILGSVVFTGAPKSGRITLYNATTTNPNLRASNKATSTIILAEFDAGQATSTTYVFDVVFTDGLIVEASANPATSTITWK